MTSKRVYLAGPMTGYPRLNFDEFFRVEETLVQLGYEVVNPARDDGGDTADEAVALAGHEPRTDWERYMRLDIAALVTCDAICLLPEWWTSKSATCEQTIAAWLRMAILHPSGQQQATVSMGNR